MKKFLFLLVLAAVSTSAFAVETEKTIDEENTIVKTEEVIEVAVEEIINN